MYMYIIETLSYALEWLCSVVVAFCVDNFHTVKPQWLEHG